MAHRVTDEAYISAEDMDAIARYEEAIDETRASDRAARYAGRKLTIAVFLMWGFVAVALGYLVRSLVI